MGINTGTSVDGVDLALVDWDANDLKNFKIIHQLSFEFDPKIKHDIEALIGLQRTSLGDLADLNFQFTRFLAALVDEFIKELALANIDTTIDLIGMHGQTVYHGHNSTLQLGRVSVLSTLTGIDCVGDFRSADIALGGCGAPLTSFFDETIIRSNTENCATLNIGGIANISVMQVNQATIAYDTGPGNTLVDVLMQKLFQKPFDKDGQIAYSGKINDQFIDSLIKRTEYFALPYPKATGRELFDEKYADKFLDLGNKENIIATASYFTAYTISQELKKFPIDKVYTSGGGTKNKFIMDQLTALNPNIKLLTHDEFGIEAQYKEAILFSLLAFTTFNKIANNIPSSTGAKKATILGVVSYA